MLEAAAIYGAVTAVTTAVSAVASVQPKDVVSGVFGNQANLLLIWSFRNAANRLESLRKNWKRLDPRENHLLYRAMLVSHWRAIQQTAGQYARHRLISLTGESELLGIESKNDADVLRRLVKACDDRILELDNTASIEVPQSWNSVIDEAYGDLTALVAQNQSPIQGPAEQAWTALEGDAPDVRSCRGFREFFVQHWYDLFSVEFQFRVTENPTMSALLTGKLFNELRNRDGAMPLDPGTILKVMRDSAQAILGAVTDSRRAIQSDIAELAAANSASHAKTESELGALGHQVTAIKTVVEGQVLSKQDEMLALLQKIATFKEVQDLSPEPRDQLLAALRKFAESEDRVCGRRERYQFSSRLHVLEVH